MGLSERYFGLILQDNFVVPRHDSCERFQLGLRHSQRVRGHVYRLVRDGVCEPL